MLRFAAITGCLAVVLGAFGAHGLSHRLADYGTTEIWKTASLYHLVHAVVLLMLGLILPQAKWAYRCFFWGVVVFSGSLYLLAVTNAKWLGAVTPFGGLALIAGWLLLAFQSRN